MYPRLENVLHRQRQRLVQDALWAIAISGTIAVATAALYQAWQ